MRPAAGVAGCGLFQWRLATREAETTGGDPVLGGTRPRRVRRAVGSVRQRRRLASALSLQPAARASARRRGCLAGLGRRGCPTEASQAARLAARWRRWPSRVARASDSVAAARHRAHARHLPLRAGPVRRWTLQPRVSPRLRGGCAEPSTALSHTRVHMSTVHMSTVHMSAETSTALSHTLVHMSTTPRIFTGSAPLQRPAPFPAASRPLRGPRF